MTFRQACDDDVVFILYAPEFVGIDVIVQAWEVLMGLQLKTGGFLITRLACSFIERKIPKKLDEP